MLVKRSKKTTTKQLNDKGSLILLWITITICFTFGYIFANYRIWHTINYIWAGIGLILIAMGIIVRWMAIIQLKNAFTVDVAIGNNQNLKTNGMYKVVRHPSYLGLLLIMTGFSICMNSFTSMFVVIIPMFFAIWYRISVEEKLLITEFKEDYSTYQLKTKKIIPWVF